MKKLWILIIFMIVSLVSIYIWKQELYNSKTVKKDLDLASEKSHDNIACNRIVSLSPSITEILFDLGLGNNIVGVTKYCDYPSDALSKKKVGGYYDLNYEQIISLEPDLVIMTKMHEEAKKYLGAFGLNILTVGQKSISDIFNAVYIIGKVCNLEQKASNIINDLKKRVENIINENTSFSKPRVIISVGRNIGTGSLEDIYIAGKNTFYNELIALAGGVNAYEGDIAYPIISIEGIIRLKPEVIIEMISDYKYASDKKSILKEWKTLPVVDAVKNDRVYLFEQDFVVIPGPRFVLLLEELVKTIHPKTEVNE